MTMLERSPAQDLLPMELPSMQSAEASHAKTLARLASVRGSTGNAAVYGLNTPDLLANYDLASSSWRTSQHCLVEGLTVFSETWPRSGMMRNGTAFRLQPLVPLTGGTASGLWPTPACSTNSMFLESNAAERNSMSLASAVHYVPTPTARDWKGSTITKNHPRGFNAGLADYVKLWPTPQASDNRDRGNLSNRSIQRRALIGKQLMLSQVVSDKSGQLNPPWVEWLMGFPTEWTVCEHSATPLSRKSQK